MSSPGGSSFGGVLNITKAKDNSKYAFNFDEESYMEKMMNFLKYKQFLNRFNNFNNNSTDNIY